MNTYLNSQIHRYGCIAAILCCLMILFGLSKILWYFLLPAGYLLGCLTGYLKSTLHLFANPESSAAQLEQPIVEQRSTPTDASVHNPSEPSPIHQQLLQDLYLLEQKARPYLNKNARHLMIEIDDIMQLMSAKIEQSDINQLKFEISDIQRTLTHYLAPALEYYCSLPPFLHHRKIADSRYTPHELVELQLQIILEAMANIAESIYQNDLNQLVDHGQFLKQKLQYSQFFKIQPSQD